MKEKLNQNQINHANGSMLRHEREPIRFTCPDIDKYIRQIEKAIEDGATIILLKDLIDYLNELRRLNGTLRKWGIKEAYVVDKLTAQMQRLKKHHRKHLIKK